MKKLIYILSIFILVLAMGACSEDMMDEINENPNDPTDVTSDLIIPDIMASTAFSVVGSDLAFYASVYIEHNVGIYGQLYNAEIRASEPTSGTTYNNSWGTIYRNLKNLKIVMDKCSDGGDEEGNYHTLGIAQVLTAYNLAVLTDLFGDVPWTEAIQPGIIYTPKLDKQEDIYKAIFNNLDDAIKNLEKETSFGELGDQDFIYGGKAKDWIKFAYGLKARYTMRLSHKTPNYADVIEYANKSFGKASEEAKFVYPDNARSPFYAFFRDRDYFGVSQSLKNKLAGDPRDTIFYKPAVGKDDDVIAPNGKPDQKQGFYSISALSTINAPTFLLSYHEIEFLKAEAYTRLGGAANLDLAKEALKKGIKAALSKNNIGVIDADAEEYFDNKISADFDSKPLEKVMIQKYIAFYEEEAIEAYNDYRRLKAMGEDYIKLAHPQTDKFPLRFTYGADDITTNFNISDAYGDGSYVYTENVWWAGGSR